jgi:hypothetical protein
MVTEEIPFIFDNSVSTRSVPLDSSIASPLLFG